MRRILQNSADRVQEMMSGTQSVRGKLRIWSQQETSKIEELQRELAKKKHKGKQWDKPEKGITRLPHLGKFAIDSEPPIFVPICSQFIDRHSHANLL